MGNALTQTGYFLFSLDTELGWGYYDKDRARVRKFSPDGSRERRSIERLLDVLDEFGITATWALVGHLFYERCALCEICPILAWKGKYESFAQIYDSDASLWYAPDMVNLLLTRGARHEIAFHGYTHEVFDEKSMSAERAKLEIDEWLRLSRARGILPRAVVFPRDRAGHLQVFKAAGFLCYRGRETMPVFYRTRYGGKLLKALDQIFAVSAPPVYAPDEVTTAPLLDLKASQEFFEFNRRLELLLDALNLHALRIRRMVKGVRRAAKEKKILHICAHPWEFQTDRDFEKLRFLLGHVADEVAAGSLVSIGMTEMADRILSAAGGPGALP